MPYDTTTEQFTGVDAGFFAIFAYAIMDQPVDQWRATEANSI